MNDFTKEELGEIKSCVYFEGWKPDGLENANQNLIDKIQSMIDNYQEIKTPTMENYCCPKCNEEWRECECKDE